MFLRWRRCARPLQPVGNERIELTLPNQPEREEHGFVTWKGLWERPGRDVGQHPVTLLPSRVPTGSFYLFHRFRPNLLLLFGANFLKNASKVK